MVDWWVLHQCTHVNNMCACVSACWRCKPLPALTVDINDDERPQSDAGHGGQLPSHQSHNLVNLAVTLFEVVLQSALLDGLCHGSGPVHGADGNDNLQTGRRTWYAEAKGLFNGQSVGIGYVWH